MKNINIELSLPNDEQDLNVNIVIKKGGMVECKTSPTTTTQPDNDLTGSVFPAVDKLAEPSEEKQVKPKSTRKKKDDTQEKSGQQKHGGNYMDIDF